MPDETDGLELEQTVNVIKEKALPKMVSGEADTVSGIATILIKIPGTFPAKSRYLSGAFGWFDNPTHGDKVKAWLTDEDNKLGGGEGENVESFIDEDMPEAYQGWFIPKDSKGVSVKGFEDLMELTAELYLKIVGIKADLESSDIFRANIYWGKR